MSKIVSLSVTETFMKFCLLSSDGQFPCICSIVSYYAVVNTHFRYTHKIVQIPAGHQFGRNASPRQPQTQSSRQGLPILEEDSRRTPTGGGDARDRAASPMR